MDIWKRKFWSKMRQWNSNFNYGRKLTGIHTLHIYCLMFAKFGKRLYRKEILHPPEISLTSTMSADIIQAMSK
jgi:hypothetical protein